MAGSAAAKLNATVRMREQRLKQRQRLLRRSLIASAATVVIGSALVALTLPAVQAAIPDVLPGIPAQGGVYAPDHPGVLEMSGSLDGVSKSVRQEACLAPLYLRAFAIPATSAWITIQSPQLTVRRQIDCD